MMRRLVLVVGFVGILLAVGEDGYGQGFQGGVRGAIRDSGGAVPGAAVSLTNEDTGLSRSALTNTLGEYAFASVEAGTYKIKIALQGYKTIERSGVRVGTQSFLVLDQSLEVGAIEESVTVSVQTPVVETANASHGAVLDSRRPRNPAFIRPRGVPHGGFTADGRALRRRPVQPAAGSDRAPPRCRSAAARAAATTTFSTASRSPTSSIARSRIRRWRRSRT